MAHFSSVYLRTAKRPAELDLRVGTEQQTAQQLNQDDIKVAPEADMEVDQDEVLGPTRLTPIHVGLLSFSERPASQWQNLASLELIKVRDYDVYCSFMYSLLGFLFSYAIVVPIR